MTEEEKKENIRSLKEFKIPADIADKVKLVKRDLIVCAHRGNRLDLRKISSERMLKLAARADYPVLALKDKKEDKAEPKAKADPKPTSSSQTSDDKDAGKKTGK